MRSSAALSFASTWSGHFARSSPEIHCFANATHAGTDAFATSTVLPAQSASTAATTASQGRPGRAVAAISRSFTASPA